MGVHHLANMHNKGPDTPNNKISYSFESPMVRHHEIDTRFAFLAHLVQKLEAKPIFWVLTLCKDHIVAAILDFMETCNTKNVHMYTIDQPVKFRGNIPQFKMLPYSPPIKTNRG